MTIHLFTRQYTQVTKYIYILKADLKHSECHSCPSAEINSSSSIIFIHPEQIFSDPEKFFSGCSKKNTSLIYGFELEMLKKLGNNTKKLTCNICNMCGNTF